MEAITIYPASFGEILQGTVAGRELLLSCPVNIYTKARVFETKHVIKENTLKKSNAFMKNLLCSWGYQEEQQLQLQIQINSSIPIGKGLASSTADLCAVYYSLLQLFNKPFNEQELIEHCIRIEPTDSIIFKELTLFDYKKGLFKKPLGEYFTFYILAFEGENVVDTVGFNNKALCPLAAVDDLITNLGQAVLKKNIKEIGAIATESIKINNKRLNYDYLEKVLDFNCSLSGKGIIGAHSGNTLGVIFEEEAALKFAVRKLSSIAIKGLKVYPVKTLDKLTINSRIV